MFVYRGEVLAEGPPENSKQMAQTSEGPLDDKGIPLHQGFGHEHLQEPGQVRVELMLEICGKGSNQLKGRLDVERSSLLQVVAQYPHHILLTNNQEGKRDKTVELLVGGTEPGSIYSCENLCDQVTPCC